MEFQREAEERAVALRAQVDALEVIDQASYDLANQVNKEATDRKKAFHAWFDPIDDASKKQRQATIAQGHLVDDPLDYVIKTTGSKAARWWRDEQARIEAEKRKAEEEARKKAEEVALIEAQALQDAGMTEAAEEVLSAPVVIEAPVIDTPAPAKADGVYYKMEYRAEVKDFMALVRAVAAGKAPPHYLAANDSALNSEARQSKGTAQIPGVVMIAEPKQTRYK